MVTKDMSREAAVIWEDLVQPLTVLLARAELMGGEIRDGDLDGVDGHLAAMRRATRRLLTRIDHLEGTVAQQTDRSSARPA
ncbi:MAG: hypothetical protein IT305_19910 [Chloroflexi bacterium]|nr:hypothetical protein [Chloroflexota bacterium]